MKEKKKFKIKNIFKNSIFTFLLGLFLASVIGVSAASLLYSKDVTYDNSSSGLSSTNLQDALDELYEQAKNGNGVSIETGEVTMGGIGVDAIKLIDTSSISGLYADSVESGRYIYRGANPDNYITFNGESAGWRIISVESDGTIKIIKDASIDDMSWDAAGTRSGSTSTYCTNASSYGCNAWASTSNLVGTPTDFTLHWPNGNQTSDTTTYSGTVTGDASLNTYLNTTYYNSLSTTARSYITSHNFNVGTPGEVSDNEDIATDVAQEALYKWNGKIGLMNITEFMRTTTNTSCTSLSAGYNGGSSNGPCNSNNWMFKSVREWSLSPRVNSTRISVWFVSNNGGIDANSAASLRGVRPALYLKSSITLSGSGTSTDPYTIN